MGSMADRHLPQELLMDILSSLPVKSLLRCKCVCKDWYSLIQNPQFINNHFNHQNNKPRQLVHHNICDIGVPGSTIPELKKTLLTFFPTEFVHQLVDYPINHEWFDLIGPINGIFMVKILIDGPNQTGLALWNPATRAFWTIPQPNLNYQPPNIQWKDCNLGFGWEPSTNDYKVVTFQFPSYYYASIKEVTAAVYSLSTNSWKQIYVTCPDLVSSLDGIFFPVEYCSNTSLPRAATYFNGAYYWLSCYSEFWNSRRWKNLKIVLFDMKMEVFRVIPTPSFDPAKYKSMRRNLELTWYNESLAMIVPENSLSGVISVGIWLMESEGSWSEYITLRPSLPLRVVTPLAFWGDGMSLIFQANGKKLLLYNPHKNDDGDEVIFIGNFASHTHRYKVFNYKESIVPIISDGRNCISAQGYSNDTETFSFVNYVAQKVATICQLSSVFS
jgi:F-box interacting protein